LKEGERRLSIFGSHSLKRAVPSWDPLRLCANFDEIWHQFAIQTRIEALIKRFMALHHSLEVPVDVAFLIIDKLDAASQSR
jgi:hypothetical protein